MSTLVSVGCYTNRFIQFVIQEIQTEDQLNRFFNAIGGQIAKTENGELRNVLREIQRRVGELAQAQLRENDERGKKEKRETEAREGDSGPQSQRTAVPESRS